jgi:hypothetical protein
MSNVVPFDTLAMALALREEAGFDQKQAEGTAKVLSRLLVADLVTKADLEAAKNELKADVREAELRLEAKTEAVKADIIKWLFGTIIAQTGIIIAAVKLLH